MTASVLQTGHNETNSSVATLALTLTGLALGSAIKVWVGLNHFFGVTSVVGSVNGAYTSTDTSADDAANKKLLVYRFVNNQATGETVTITFDSAHANVGAAWAEVGGVKAAAFDIAATGRVQATPTTGTDLVLTNAASNTAQPALIVAASWNESGNAPAAGTGFTSIATIDWSATGPGGQMLIESKRITAIASQTASFTAAANSTHLNVMTILDESTATTQLYTSANNGGF